MAVLFAISLLLLEPILSDDPRASWSASKKIEFMVSGVLTKIRQERKIYLENLAKIEEHNEKFRKGLVSYSMAMNPFGHLDEEGFRDLYANTHADETNGWKDWKEYSYFQVPENVTLPKAVDWRLRGALTNVKSQGRCRSSYIFAAIDTIESQYNFRYNKLVEFSAQQVLDCTRQFGKNGCEGGLASAVFSYALHVGLTTEKRYPYVGVNLPCRLKGISVTVRIKGFARIRSHSVGDMMAAVALQGPVSIGLNLDGLQFVSGKEVLTGHWCKGKINHSVVVVGYNTTPEGQDYWIVRNSWGEMWGDKGYFLLERDNADLCNLTKQVFFPMWKMDNDLMDLLDIMDIMGIK